jgi:hypothetical protein
VEQAIVDPARQRQAERRGAKDSDRNEMAQANEPPELTFRSFSLERKRVD